MDKLTEFYGAPRGRTNLAPDGRSRRNGTGWMRL